MNFTLVDFGVLTATVSAIVGGGIAFGNRWFLPRKEAEALAIDLAEKAEEKAKRVLDEQRRIDETFQSVSLCNEIHKLVDFKLETLLKESGRANEKLDQLIANGTTKTRPKKKRDT